MKARARVLVVLPAALIFGCSESAPTTPPRAAAPATESSGGGGGRGGAALPEKTPPAPTGAAQTPAVFTFGTRTPKPKPEGSVRLATYNVENLFDDFDDPALTGSNDDKNETKPADHLKAAADAIRTVNADILCLQEIESERALLWFRDNHLTDLGYSYVVSIDAGDERGIEQAVLSKFPLKDPTQWLQAPLGGTHPDTWGSQANFNAGQPITFHRSPLRVTVEIPPPAGVVDEPYRLTLFVVHQKSGGPGAYWREREAIKTVELVKQLEAANADVNVAIVGDFNAVRTDDAFRPYLDAGLRDSFGDFPLDAPEYLTHASSRRIDYILANESFSHEIVPDSRFVFATATRPEGHDYRSTSPPPGYASDHFPVVIDVMPQDR